MLRGIQKSKLLLSQGGELLKVINRNKHALLMETVRIVFAWWLLMNLLGYSLEKLHIKITPIIFEAE